MNLYSKLEKHLLREKEKDNGKADFCGNLNDAKALGFNACKAQYDEVLRRANLDWEAIENIMLKNADDESRIWFGDTAQEIANSPDVIKVEGE